MEHLAKYRGSLFCLVLALLWIPCLSILIQFHDLWRLGNAVPGEFFARMVARTAPFIAQDASFFGEFTPVAIAAGLTALAPKQDEKSVFLAALIICVIGWALFLTLSVSMEPGSRFYDALFTLLEGDGKPKEDLIVLKGFATSTRVFYLVIGAALLGIRLRKEA